MSRVGWACHTPPSCVVYRQSSTDVALWPWSFVQDLRRDEIRGWWWWWWNKRPSPTSSFWSPALSYVSAGWQQAASTNRGPAVKHRRYELLYIDSPSGAFIAILFRWAVILWPYRLSEKNNWPRIETILHTVKVSVYSMALMSREEKRSQTSVLVKTWCVRLQHRHSSYII